MNLRPLGYGLTVRRLPHCGRSHSCRSTDVEPSSLFHHVPYMRIVFTMFCSQIRSQLSNREMQPPRREISSTDAPLLCQSAVVAAPRTPWPPAHPIPQCPLRSRRPATAARPPDHPLPRPDPRPHHRAQPHPQPRPQQRTPTVMPTSRLHRAHDRHDGRACRTSASHSRHHQGAPEAGVAGSNPAGGTI